MGAGAAIGLGTLVGQLVLYMGWNDFLTDAQFTFFARNQFRNDAAALQNMREFFDSRNIAFWFNFENGSRFRNIKDFVTSFMYYDFQVHTPFFTVLCALLLFGLLFGYLWKERTSPNHAIDDNSKRRRTTFGFLVALQAFALFVFLVVIIDKLISFGIRGDTARFLPAPVQLWITAAVALFVTGAGVIVAIQLMQRRGEIGNISRDIGRLSLFILIVALMLGSQYQIYDRLYEPVWNEVLQAAFPRPFQYLTLLLAVAIAFTVAVKMLKRPFSDWIDQSPFHLMAFVCSGLAAYIVVYILSPGYIFSGYRTRLAPLTVFHTTMVAALALYIVASLALQCFRISRPSEARVGSGGTPGRQSVEIRCKSLVGFGCVALLTLMFWYWGIMQAVYLRLLPPDNYSFLKRLSQPPYAGASFIVNTYAAPIAAATGNWAYLHASAAEGKLVERNGRFEMARDPGYLWFADKRTNAAYDRPEYFICISTPSLWSMAETLRYVGGRGEGYPGCGKHRFVRLARRQDKANVYPTLTVVEADQEGMTKVGFERWAIVKLTW
jgi:hypothetical protein